MQQDRFLVERLKCGDAQALCCIYDRYGPALLALGTKLLGDRAAAEGVLHDVFLAFAEHIQRFELTGSLRSYLAKCVANRSRDRFRRRHKTVFLGDGIPTVISPQPGPEEVAEQDDEVQQVGRALDALPYEQREVVLLRTHGGMKFRQIAAVQGVSVNTAQGRYRYAMEKLRALLDVEADHAKCTGYRTVG